MQFTPSLFSRNSLWALCCSIGLLAGGTQGLASDEEHESETRVESKLIEIYRIAPGKHRAFLEAIASYDKANEMAGLPPRELYIHSNGAGWDFMLIQPASTPDGHRERLNEAWSELGLPSGADFFFSFRQYILDHEDTFVSGPTSAQAFLDSASD